MFAQHTALELWSVECTINIIEFFAVKLELHSNSQPMQLACLSSIHYKI